VDEGSDPVAPAKAATGVLATPTVVAAPRADDAVSSAQPPPAPQFRLGNRPALTGIRAIGIALVLIFHSDFSTFPGAWSALGVFFVLSGFLITTMLANEQQKTGSISLSQFYSRRAVRLLPPLFIAVALLAVYAGLVHVYSAANNLWGDVTAAVFYFADYRSAFGHEPATGFLAQCWSLAVEEQFYVIWAVLLFVALKYGNRRLAYAIAITGIVASTVNRVWIVLHAQHWNNYVAGRVYYAFDTRADALFLGCLLGLIATGGHLDNWKPQAKRILVGLALLSFGVMIWIICTVDLTARSLPLWWLPVSEVASAVIIAYLVIHPEGIGTRALSIPSLVLLGNMSYAIYLFHWPVFVAISPYTVTWPFWVEEIVRMVIIMALVMTSWYLVEQPLMFWRRKALNPTGPDVSLGQAGVPEAAIAEPAMVTPAPVKPAAPTRRAADHPPRPAVRRVMATDLLAPLDPGIPAERVDERTTVASNPSPTTTPIGQAATPSRPVLATDLLAPDVPADTDDV
jgi:peptidoglycan/LPS O-acetylase OafA/YrhL